MPTEAPARTHCPNCGAKLHRQDLSLCAYCATPLTLGGKVEVAGDETAQRLARLREHAAFASAMAATPREPEIEERVRRGKSAAGFLFVAGALAVMFALGGGSSVLLGTGIGTCAIAIVFAVLAAGVRRKAESLPLLRRPALVVSRRSSTSEERGRAATTYFFTLHFDDASEGEFRWPGQGTMYEPMPNGTTGLAYTRGERLVEFKKL